MVLGLPSPLKRRRFNRLPLLLLLLLLAVFLLGVTLSASFLRGGNPSSAGEARGDPPIEQPRSPSPPLSGASGGFLDLMEGRRRRVDSHCRVRRARAAMEYNFQVTKNRIAWLMVYFENVFFK